MKGFRVAVILATFAVAACENNPTVSSFASSEPRFSQGTPLASSIVVESNGPYEIYSWSDSNGDHFRVVDEYNSSDHLIRSTYYRNHVLVGTSDARRASSQLLDARTDSRALPEREWTRYHRNLTGKHRSALSASSTHCGANA
jgi:hypothetical protein